jgi:hypothetical protein
MSLENKKNLKTMTILQFSLKYMEKMVVAGAEISDKLELEPHKY